MEHIQNNYSRRRRRRWCFECSSKALLLIFNIFILQTSISNTAPIHSNTKAMMYLAKYGYLPIRFQNQQSARFMSEEKLSRAIREFQSFAGLELTGYLDEDTMATMSLPRCGVPDFLFKASGSRSKRYEYQGTKWRSDNLTYKITKYSMNIDKSDTDSAVERAFQFWANAAHLNFKRKASLPVHIEIRFETYKHGDSYPPFDGPGGILGHAFYPDSGGGDVHFDDSETWTVKTRRGTNLFQVAVHQIGHSLGLAHSKETRAVMDPFYRGYDSNFRLHEDDVLGIQALYGSWEEDEDPIDTTLD